MRVRVLGLLVAVVMLCSIQIPVWSPTTLSLVGVAGAQAPGATAIPRTRDGKPDLSGFWQVMNTANVNVQDHQAQNGEPAGQGVVEGNEIPYRPEALKQKQQNYANRATEDTVAKCNLPGVPRITYVPFPFQIVYAPTGDVGGGPVMMMMYEYAHAIRYIHANGTPHPPGHIDWWMGDSRGRWEGDTLVVDVTHFHPDTRFDRAGNFHSDALHVVERYTLIDRDHINYEVTLEDPKVFTRPWKMSMILYRHIERNFAVLEYECYGFPFEKLYPYPEVAAQDR